MSKRLNEALDLLVASEKLYQATESMTSEELSLVVTYAQKVLESRPKASFAHEPAAAPLTEYVMEERTVVTYKQKEKA